jgi:hypothetical protein
VLASWQYGLGRAVAWTSDEGTQWATRWSARRLPGFWVDLVRWSLRGYNPGTRVPALQVADGQLHISATRYTAGGAFDDTAAPRVRVVGPDGSAQVVALSLAGPGSYAAALPLAGPGLYTATLGHDDRSPVAPADVAALAVPYDAEYTGDGVDTAFLTHLAAASGGQSLVRPADAFEHSGLPPTVSWLPLWPLLLALALLLFPVEVGVRLLVPPDPVFRR